MTTFGNARTPMSKNLMTRRAFMRTAATAGVAATVAPALAGCSSGTSNKTKVRVALCQQALGNGMPTMLREKFPEVEFQFTQAQNSAAYYKYLNEHDDLPDIITVRRFSLRDASQLKDTLTDLSSSDIAAGYYQNYLNNYTYDDGVVNWLPSTAEIWSIVANKSLFDEKGIAIPTDYPSFKAACEAFEAQGIRGFVTDWKYDYSCLETLEGFNTDLLQSLDGQRWRTEYESVTVDELDDTVWPAAFTHMQEVLADTKNNTAESLELGMSAVQGMLEAREAAMIRSSGAEMAGFIADTGDEFIMLPYFGETEAQNWVLTYPNFQAAINANSKVDAGLLQDIFEYMLGQDVQDTLNANLNSKTNVLSYTSAVTIEQSEQLSTVQSYFDNNQVYTRLANNDFFTASQAAVSGLIDGSMDATAAYTAFNESLASSSSEVVYDLNFEKGYEYNYQDGKGSESSSALLNTCREVWGCDLAVTYATSFSNSVYEGKASSSQLKYLVAGNYGPLYLLDLTGAQLKEVVGNMVEFKTSDSVQLVDSLNPVSNDMLPVSSGFEMQIKRNDDNTYTLEGITIDGEAVDDSKTFNVMVNIANTTSAAVIMPDIDIPEDANKKVTEFPAALAEYFSDTSKQLLEPTAYIKLS